MVVIRDGSRHKFKEGYHEKQMDEKAVCTGCRCNGCGVVRLFRCRGYRTGRIRLFVTSGLSSEKQKLPRWNNRPEIAVLNVH